MPNLRKLGIYFFLVSTLTILGACGNEEESVEDYPEHEIEMVIPWDPGGGSDIEGRVVIDHVSEAIDESMVAVNVPGVGGTVGLEELSEEENNGYHIGQIHEGHLVANHTDISDISYKDFEPIASMSASDQLLAVSSELDIDSLEEFVEYGQNNTIDFGGTVSGIPRVWVEQIGRELDIDYNLVGYEGLGEAVQALAGAHVDAVIADYPSTSEFVKSGHMKILAIGTEERNDALPDVPTFQEEGYDMTMGINRGYVAPKGTDPEIIEKLSDTFEEVANSDEFVKEIEKLGASVNFMDSEKYAEYLDNQDQVIKETIESIE